MLLCFTHMKLAVKARRGWFRGGTTISHESASITSTCQLVGQYSTVGRMARVEELSRLVEKPEKRQICQPDQVFQLFQWW